VGFTIPDQVTVTFPLPSVVAVKLGPLGVALAVEVQVGGAETVPVALALGAAVAVADGVGSTVVVAVALEVSVSDAVAAAVGVVVDDAVEVADAVALGTGVALETGDGVALGTGDGVALGVAVEVATTVKVAALVGVVVAGARVADAVAPAVAVAVWAASGSAGAMPPSTRRPSPTRSHCRRHRGQSPSGLNVMRKAPRHERCQMVGIGRWSARGWSAWIACPVEPFSRD